MEEAKEFSWKNELMPEPPSCMVVTRQPFQNKYDVQKSLPTIERVYKNCTYIGLVSHAILLPSQRAVINIYEGFYGGGKDSAYQKFRKNLLLDGIHMGSGKFFHPYCSGEF